VIGWLFGWKSTVKKGTEILMILTPRVIDTRDETDLLTRDFRSKILGAMAVEDVRKLYDLEEKKNAEDVPATVFSPEAEGN
jgi:general secretion pathway protein D